MMRSKAIVCTLTAAALGIGSAAQAQQQWQPANQPRQSQGQPAHQRQGERHWQNQAQGERHWQGQGQRWQGQHWQAPQAQRWQPQRQWHGYAPQYRAYNQAPRYYAAPRYYGPPRYAIGGYVPYPYRAHRYWVNDWRAYDLAPPPYGYQWVETDSGDFLLMALATGLIAGAILSSQ